MITTCCSIKHARPKNHEVVICLNQDCKNYLAPTDLVIDKTVPALTSLFIFMVLVLFSFNNSSTAHKTQEELRLVFLANYTIHPPCTQENLRLEIVNQQILCPDQVFAQIMIESAYLSSFLFKRTNNLLGMRFPYKRATTAIGIYLPALDTVILGTQKELVKYNKQNHYAVFDSWHDCVTDYKLWQEQQFNLTEKYLNFLGAYYAEDANYIAKIKKLSK